MVETIVRFNNRKELFDFALLANKCSGDVFYEVKEGMKKFIVN